MTTTTSDSSIQFQPNRIDLTDINNYPNKTPEKLTSEYSDEISRFIIQLNEKYYNIGKIITDIFKEFYEVHSEYVDETNLQIGNYILTESLRDKFDNLFRTLDISSDASIDSIRDVISAAADRIDIDAVAKSIVKSNQVELRDFIVNDVIIKVLDQYYNNAASNGYESSDSSDFSSDASNDSYYNNYNKSINYNQTSSRSFLNAINNSVEMIRRISGVASSNISKLKDIINSTKSLESTISTVMKSKITDAIFYNGKNGKLPDTTNLRNKKKLRATRFVRIIRIWSHTVKMRFRTARKKLVNSLEKIRNEILSWKSVGKLVLFEIFTNERLLFGATAFITRVVVEAFQGANSLYNVLKETFKNLTLDPDCSIVKFFKDLNDNILIPSGELILLQLEKAGIAVFKMLFTALTVKLGSFIGGKFGIIGKLLGPLIGYGIGNILGNVVAMPFEADIDRKMKKEYETLKQSTVFNALDLFNPSLLGLSDFADKQIDDSITNALNKDANELENDSNAIFVDLSDIPEFDNSGLDSSSAKIDGLNEDELISDTIKPDTDSILDNTDSVERMSDEFSNSATDEFTRQNLELQQIDEASTPSSDDLGDKIYNKVIEDVETNESSNLTFTNKDASVSKMITDSIGEETNDSVSELESSFSDINKLNAELDSDGYHAGLEFFNEDDKEEVSEANDTAVSLDDELDNVEKGYDPDIGRAINTAAFQYDSNKLSLPDEHITPKLPEEATASNSIPGEIQENPSDIPESDAGTVDTSNIEKLPDDDEFLAAADTVTGNFRNDTRRSNESSSYSPASDIASKMNDAFFGSSSNPTVSLDNNTTTTTAILPDTSAGSNASSVTQNNTETTTSDTNSDITNIQPNSLAESISTINANSDEFANRLFDYMQEALESSDTSEIDSETYNRLREFFDEETIEAIINKIKSGDIRFIHDVDETTTENTTVAIISETDNGSNNNDTSFTHPYDEDIYTKYEVRVNVY